MSVRAMTIAGFVVLACLAAAAYLAGRTGRLGLAPLGDVVDAVRSSPAGRFVLLLAWAWVGWHLLAR